MIWRAIACGCGLLLMAGVACMGDEVDANDPFAGYSSEHSDQTELIESFLVSRDRAVENGLAPAHVENLPEGVSLRAIVNWRGDKSWRAWPPNLLIGVVVIGNGSDTIIAFGEPHVVQLKTDPGQRLRPRESWTPIDLRPLELLQREVSTPAKTTPPWLEFRYDHPLSNPTFVSPEIQFTLQTAERIEWLEVTDLSTLFQPQDDLLKSCGFRLLRADLTANNVALDFLSNPLAEDRLLGVQLIDEAGERVGRDSIGTGLISQNRQTGRLEYMNSFPNGGKLEFRIARALKQHRVSASWDRVPVPVAPTVTRQQMPTLIWTHNSADVDTYLARAQIQQDVQEGPESLPPDRPLRLAIDMVNPSGRQIVAWSKLLIKKAATGDTKLLLSQPTFFDMLKWQTLPPSFRSSHAGATIYLSLKGLPGQRLARIDEFEATCDIATASSMTDVFIRDAESMVNQRIDDPSLTQAGLEVVVTAKEKYIEVKVNRGDMTSIESIMVFGRNCSSLTQHTSRMNGSRTIGCPIIQERIEGADPLPPKNVNLRLRVRNDFQVTPVKFHFRGTPVPPVEERFRYHQEAR